MTTSNGKSAEEILLTFQRRAFAAQSELDVIDERHKALAALEEIIVAAKPESKLNPSTFKEGWDEGVNQYEQNIRQAFSNGGGDE